VQKLILILVSLLMMSVPGITKEEELNKTFYCLEEQFVTRNNKSIVDNRTLPVYDIKEIANNYDNHRFQPYRIYSENNFEGHELIKNRCKKSDNNSYEIPKKVYLALDESQYKYIRIYSDNLRRDSNYYKNCGFLDIICFSYRLTSFNRERIQEQHDIFINSKSDILNHQEDRNKFVSGNQQKQNEIAEAIRKREVAELNRKKELERLATIEKDFDKFCKNFQKGSAQYNSCLLEKDKIAKEGEKKKELARKNEEERISKMSVDERSAYTCTERFGFRKGSESFKQCVFKLYTAEMDYKKQEQESALRQSEINKLRAEIQSLQSQIANQRSERNVVVLRDSERSLAELNAIEERNRLDRGRFALELADQIRRNSTPARQQLDIPRQPTRCRFGPGGWLNCNN